MLRELNHREADGGNVQVSLDWETTTNEITLTLIDRAWKGQVTVMPEDAAVAYEHPYTFVSP